MMTFDQMAEASKVLRRETPKPKISHTLDLYPTLSPIQRHTLLVADQRGLKLLNSINPRV